MAEIRNAILDADKIAHELVAKRRRMEQLARDVEAEGARRAASLAIVEVANFDWLLKTVAHLVACLESTDAGEPAAAAAQVPGSQGS